MPHCVFNVMIFTAKCKFTLFLGGRLCSDPILKCASRGGGGGGAGGGGGGGGGGVGVGGVVYLDGASFPPSPPPLLAERLRS